MVRERASVIYPAVYLSLITVCLIFIYFDSDWALPFLILLSIPWSLLITFFLAWGMMHDGGIFGLSVLLYTAGALVNTFIAFKIGLSTQYNYTVGKET